MDREILLLKPYHYQPGCKESGNTWSSIAEDLTKILELHFDINQKGARDRCPNLLETHEKR